MTSVRARYLALGALVVLAGLAVHLKGVWIPRDARDMAGDALWAVMMAAWVSAIWPRSRYGRYVVALAICFAVEFSQLWQLPALQDGRSTLVGRLLLGSGFDMRDFVSYALGILIFIALDRRWLKW